MISEITYNEVAAGQVIDMRNAELQQLKKLYSEFDAEALKISDATVKGVNLAREIGLNLQTLAGGKEQLSFTFWQKNCEGKLPFSFEAARRFVAVAKKMPEPASTIGEVAHLTQGLLIADNLLQLPERTGAQTKSEMNEFQIFFNAASVFRQPFEKIVRENPMEKWNTKDLKTFLNETEWIEEERAKARNLLKAK